MPPTVFISYSWDSLQEWGEQNEQWVLDLVNRLAADNIAVHLDKQQVHPGDSIPHFMEKAIADNDKVLIICTPRYKFSSDNRKGAVGYESHIISSLILQSGDHRKFITVIKQGDEKTAVPTGLIGKYHIRLNDPAMYEAQYRLLVDAIHNRWNVNSPTPAEVQAGKVWAVKVPDMLNLSFAVLHSMDKAGIKVYINHYKKLVQANSFNAAGWFGLGLCTLHYASNEAAALHLERAIELDGTNADYHYYLALALCGGQVPGRLDRATFQKVLDAVQRAISLDDGQGKYYVLLRVLYEEYFLKKGLQLLGYSDAEAIENSVKNKYTDKDELKRLAGMLQLNIEWLEKQY